MNNKILSISVAAYNVAETLRECIDPLVHSDVIDKLDIMIVNDGSKDDTPSIAQAYVDAFPDSVRLINKENGGWGSTLNVGMKEAVGKYFKQLDGDDFYSPENLGDFIKFLENSTADAVYSPFVMYEHGTGAIIRLVGTYTCFPYGKNIMLHDLNDFAPAMHTWTVKTSVLQENPITITEHCFYTDVEFVLKTCNYCETVSFFPLPIYYYRLARSGQSMSVAGVRKHYQDHLKMVTGMLKYEKEHLIDPKKKNIFFIRLLGACEMQYLFFFALDCTHKQKKELIAFDKLIKDEYPKYFARLRGNQIRFLRATHFWGYWIIGHLKTRKDRKLKQNVFEGT